MRWLSQQLGDVADKANGQVIMPYACGHVQGKVKRRCRAIHLWHPVKNGGVLDDDHNAIADVSVIPPHLARPITHSAFTALFSGVPIARSDPARFACRSVP
jgi:hypothetical protein